MLNFNFNAFSVSLLIIGVVALLVSLIVFQRPGKALKWFATLMLCSAIWAVFYSFELASHSLRQMLFFIDLEYIGISFIPATWIVFVILFINRENWLILRNWIAIFSFPVIALILVWTNDWHHLHYESVSLDTTSGPFPLLAIKPGPWYHVHTAYFYFLLAFGLYLMTKRFFRSDKVYRRQNLIILIGAFIPWTVNFVYLLGFRPYGHIDLTPYAFIATSIVISFGLIKYKLFYLVPTAREKVLQAIQEGMVVLDSDGRVADVNRIMKIFLRPYSKDPVGIHFNEILPKEYKLHQAIAYHKDQKIEITLTRSAANRHFEVAVTPLFDEMRFVGTLLIFWEITSRKETEKKLKEQADELMSLNQMKDRMFSIISHDVRAPLASLKGILSIAEKGMISQEEFNSFLPTLAKNVGYASSLLENLLHWSRSQLGGETVKFELFDLHDAVRDEMIPNERISTQKNIELRNNIAKGTVVYADRNMIRLVIRNLIGNAIKFSGNGSSVILSGQANSNTTTVAVKDTGTGIKEDMKKHLFELSVESTDGTSGEKGTGLGLKLCKDFVTKNDGTIWVDSEEGVGSTFFFKLKNTP